MKTCWLLLLWLLVGCTSETATIGKGSRTSSPDPQSDATVMDGGAGSDGSAGSSGAAGGAGQTRDN